MSSKELTLVEPDVLTPEEKTELNADIDRIIEAHKANRKEINRLVFESVAAMTEADEAGTELANKGWFARMIGDWTGSNQKLQDKINSSHAAAQYASQLTLQKLAEQNLMSFDLLTAVNNKLNASMQRVGEEFNRIYTGLGKFFQYNQNQLVRMELRMEKVERNVKLLTWQNSIEYLDFNGEEYTDMDDAKKIVCLVRDFYDITQGDYSTSDLLLLKAAMSSIEIEPKSQVNYGAILNEIAENDALKEKLLGGKRIRPVTDPGYLIAMSGLQKMDALQNEEKYTVDTVAGYVSKYDSTVTAKQIGRDLVANYLRDAAGVNVNLELDSFDMVLDLLYNLKQAEVDHLLVSSEEALALPEGEGEREAAEAQEEKKSEEKDLKLQSAEKLFLDYKLEEAYKIFMELAEAGNGRAMYYLCEYAGHGYAPEKEDEAKARGWLRKGVVAGDPLAAVRYAALLPNSSAKRKELLDKFAQKVTALAETGDPVAQNEAAKMFENGIGVEADTGKMREWMAKSADSGYWRSKYELGQYYAKGLGGEKNLKEAFSWYTQSAMDGYDAAQTALGNCHYYGEGIEKDYLESISWYEKAAEQNNAEAMKQLGHCYCDGTGVDQNYTAAIDWYQKAAKLNNDDAYNGLAYCYYNGFGVVRDYKMAVKYWRKAIELGSAKAAYHLGECYEDGRGVWADNSETLKWYKKAAEDGYAKAQYKLGWKYEIGWGPLYTNEAEAVKWYKLAAEQGYIDALTEMGSRYRYGNGVEQNLEKAIEYYRKAAELGDETARNILQVLQNQ